MFALKTGEEELPGSWLLFMRRVRVDLDTNLFAPGDCVLDIKSSSLIGSSKGCCGVTPEDREVLLENVAALVSGLIEEDLEAVAPRCERLPLRTPEAELDRTLPVDAAVCDDTTRGEAAEGRRGGP